MSVSTVAFSSSGFKTFQLLFTKEILEYITKYMLGNWIILVFSLIKCTKNKCGFKVSIPYLDSFQHFTEMHHYFQKLLWIHESLSHSE